MDSKTIANGILRAIGTLIVITLILLFLYRIQSVLVYLSIAVVLSLIARPVLQFFENKLKLPHLLAVILTMFLFLSLIFGIISMFIPLVMQQGHNLSILSTSDFQSDVKSLLERIVSYFNNKGIDLSDRIGSIDFSAPIKSIPGLLNAVLGTIGSLSMGLFSVLFILFFLMKDQHILHNLFIAIIPDDKEERIVRSLKKIINLLSRYFVGLIIQIGILFIIYSLILLVSGVESAIVIAFLSAILNIIPYIGPLIGGVFMIILTMTSNLEYDFQSVVLPTTLWVFIGYIVAQMIDNFFSQPMIFSKSVNSHPLEIFLVIIIGGLLFGIVGMILAVPTYTALKVILKEYLSENQVIKTLTKDFD